MCPDESHEEKQYWIEEYTYMTCPNCGEEFSDEMPLMSLKGDSVFNHCPNCGKRLYFKKGSV